MIGLLRTVFPAIGVAAVAAGLALPLAIAPSDAQTPPDLATERQKSEPVGDLLNEFGGLPIVVSIKLRVKPAMRQQFLKLATSTAASARKEPGMISYAVYEEVNQRDAFLVFMELAGKSSLNKHLGTSYAQTFLKALPAFAVAEPSTRIYTIQGLDFVLGF